MDSMPLLASSVLKAGEKYMSACPERETETAAKKVESLTMGQS